MSQTPPKKQRKLVNWEPSKPGRRALRDMTSLTGMSNKACIEQALVNEVARIKAFATDAQPKGVVL